MSDSIEELRKSIEKLDQDIIKSVSERMRLSGKIGKMKKQNSTPIQYPNIESAVKRRYIEFASDLKVSEEFFEKLSDLILKESVRIQKKS